MKRIAAALIWKCGKVLAGLRPEQGPLGGYWEFPGGKLEPGETPEQCAVRECREELSAEIRLTGLFGRVFYEYDEPFELYFFNAELVGGTVKPNVHTALRWVSPGELGKFCFCPANAEILKKIMERPGEASMLLDLLKKNRSYRGYDESVEIGRETLEELVDCTRYTPSSVNMQPLKYYLACEKGEVARIQRLTKWARALPQLVLPHKGCCPTAFIVICQDTNICDSIPRFQKDVGIVAQTILLAAVEQGLGGCMIGNYSGEEVSRELSLPGHLIPVLVVAIGKPQETIVLTDVDSNGPTDYYRDENDVHYVPKRKLGDLLIN